VAAASAPARPAPSLRCFPERFLGAVGCLEASAAGGSGAGGQEWQPAPQRARADARERDEASRARARERAWRVAREKEGTVETGRTIRAG